MPLTCAARAKWCDHALGLHRRRAMNVRSNSGVGMDHYQMLIGGAWVDASDGARLDSVNPFTQSVWASIPQASDADVGRAIDAAHAAFVGPWRRVNGRDRAKLMLRLADLIERDAENLAILETTDNGKVIRETRPQMQFAARNYRYFAGLADKLQGETIPLDNADLFDFTLVEPLGVAVLITAWNSPLVLLANKLAPALAAGNTVVIKPSELASVSTLAFGRLVQEAGFPPGVVNIVTGDGRLGAALTTHRRIAKISFTGGIETARKILTAAAHRLVPVTTELGGKSPNIIFADANLDAAVVGAVAGIFGASGQTCIAGSRLLVERSVYSEVVRRVIDKARTIRLGNPADPATEMGPVANKAQFDRILQMIEAARAEGATIALGGNAAQISGLHGYFIEPTIVIDARPDMGIVCNEVFGPVLSVLPFEDEADAVQIANATDYGLAAGIWTDNIRRAHRMARVVDAGMVWMNTYRASFVGAPFGGTKLSGQGRERAIQTLREYTRIKNVMLDLSEEERDPFAMKL